MSSTVIVILAIAAALILLVFAALATRRLRVRRERHRARMSTEAAGRFPAQSRSRRPRDTPAERTARTTTPTTITTLVLTTARDIQVLYALGGVLLTAPSAGRDGTSRA
jgi:hypothetical protein